MKFNKNIIAFAFCLAMSCPVKCDESTENTNLLTNIEETITTEIISDAITALTSSNTIEQVTTVIDNAVNNIITASAEQATTMLETFSQNLTDGTKFKINNTTFVVNNTRAMNAAEEQIIETIGSDLLDSAISTVSSDIETAQVHNISQANAVTLLQSYAASLIAGSSFTFNGTTYTVQASQN